MRIAVIGTGSVGSVLGRRWAEAGHEVAFCSRNPQDAKVVELLAACGPTVVATSSTGAACGEADVVVLAVPWSAAEENVRAAGEMSGKVLIDCTNPVKSDVSGLSVGHSTSAAEKVAGWSVGAHVVKAFNTIHASTMADPGYGFESANLFLCGDHEKANEVVAALGRDLDLEPMDVGPLRAARWLEPMAMLWIHLSMRQAWGTDFAFKIVKR